ncbi:MAG: hypothetical protein ACI9SB_000019 [Candidatus Azotimanducaceae bacterium]|jgi:hypothetical protein
MPVVYNEMAGKGQDTLWRTLVQASQARGLRKEVVLAGFWVWH